MSVPGDLVELEAAASSSPAARVGLDKKLVEQEKKLVEQRLRLLRK